MSRSGAGTQAKLTELSKPTFFVSLASSAGNEQTHNARHLKRSEAAVAPTSKVSSARLPESVGPLLADPRVRWGVSERPPHTAVRTYWTGAWTRFRPSRVSRSPVRPADMQSPSRLDEDGTHVEHCLVFAYQGPGCLGHRGPGRAWADYSRRRLRGGRRALGRPS
ncbi:glycosyltransferase [Streptomyces sp. NPDC088560]|uniref:glycosyltransferase n=1 Tax=Streptomyces sp. NPDC088560 TaxID=3365868 RepID=UPI00381ADAD9